MEDENNLDPDAIYKILFWLTPFLIGLVQLLYIGSSTYQIRYEELADSVRNVYWLDQRTVYDGVSSSVGWYAILLTFYKIFGFSLFTAKYVKLIIFVIGLFSFCIILRRYFSYKQALIPLLAIGLSPTILFFNIIQAPYAGDIPFFFISLLLLTRVNSKKFKLAIFYTFLGFSFAMLGWMIYPTFIYFMPILVGGLYWKIASFKKILKKTLLWLISISSFVLPLLLVLFYLKNPFLLLYDPKTQGGIFRGAGTFSLSLSNFFNNLKGLSIDLFVKGNSYYFESPIGDFSLFFPFISFLTIIGFSIYCFKKQSKSTKLLITVILLTFIFNLIISSLTIDPSKNPGVRRYTSLLVSFYLLYTICWYYLLNINFRSRIFKYSMLTVFLIIPLQHLLALPINLNALTKPSPYQYSLWFNQNGMPEESLSSIIEYTTKQDLKLSCQDEEKDNVTCRYQEIFAAVKGSCKWNRLDCKTIQGYDDKTKQYIPLEIKLWEEYYWEH